MFFLGRKNHKLQNLTPTKVVQETLKEIMVLEDVQEKLHEKKNKKSLDMLRTQRDTQIQKMSREESSSVINELVCRQLKSHIQTQIQGNIKQEIDTIKETLQDELREEIRDMIRQEIKNAPHIQGIVKELVREEMAKLNLKKKPEPYVSPFTQKIETFMVKKMDKTADTKSVDSFGPKSTAARSSSKKTSIYDK